MQKVRRKSQKWRGLTTIFCTILMISLCVSSVISSFSGFFGGTPAEIIDLSGETAESLQYFKSSYDSIGDMLEAKSDLCEQISDEGIVLVKNDGVLPLEGVEKVTCLGRSSTDLIYGGSSGAGTIGNAGTSMNATLKEGLEKAGYEVNPAMWNFYSESEYTATYSTSGFTTGEVPVEEYPDEKEYEAYGDACIVVFARNAGEGNDVAATETSDGSLFYQINDKEKEVLKEAKENFDKVIVLINSPSALSIEELKADADINAVLVAGGLGMNGAKSFGSILNGTVNPSGKLTDTYAVNSLSSPAAQNIGDYTYTNAAELTGMSNNGFSECNTKYLVQAEGIYIGYKYYETRYEDCVLNQGNADSGKGSFASKDGWDYKEEVSYSLGYGMSYTDFTQELAGCTVADGVITATVTVKNTGAIPGKDVVQLYVQCPYTEYDVANGIEKASVQLVNFAKTDLLEPDESETVEVKMDLYNICSYDDAEAKTWILEDGNYYFAIGSSAHDALNNILASKGKHVEDGMDYEGDSDKTAIWKNDEFMEFENPGFSEDGFTTFAGTYHREAENSITNRLQNADLNLYSEGQVQYLTRSDWESSWPQSYEGITATDEMAQHLCAKLYEAGDSDTSGIVTGAGTKYQLSMMRGKSYDDEGWNQILDQLTMDDMLKMAGRNYSAIDPVASVAYPGSTVEDGPAGINSNYSEEYNTGDTIYDDIENYSDISPKMYPSEFLAACTFNQELVYRMGEMFGEDSLYSDQTAVWAPGLNIHRTPYSGRNFEYFSEDSMISYILGAQEVAGMQTKGAVAAPKHFAFNDYETNRWGVSAFMTEQAARENSLRAFEGALSVGQAKCVMTALNRIGCDWVGLSDHLMNGILRNEWGFDGYTITDIAVMPYMYGYAVTTGTDKFLVARTGSYDKQLSSEVLEKDAKLLSALRESCHRILYVDVNSNAMNGISEDISIKTQMPSWKMMLIGVNLIIILLCLVSGFMFVRAEQKRRKEQS